MGDKVAEGSATARSRAATPPVSWPPRSPSTARPEAGHLAVDGVTHRRELRRARRLQLRRANVSVALLSSIGVMLGVVIYLVTTAGQPNRVLIWAIQGLALMTGAAIVTLARRRQPTRLLMHLWTMISTLLTIVAAIADGGLTSPLLLILFVPLGLTAMALRARPMVGHSALALAGLIVAGLVTDTFSLGTVVLYAACLGSLVMVGVGLANNTRRLTRRLEEANDELAELSRRDPLTGCLNHRAFYEEVDRALARSERTGNPVSLVVLDVDHFKAVNDEHGHPTGDTVLVALSEALRRRSRAADVVGRTGGEEFAVLLPDTSLRAATTMVERLRCAVAEADTPVPVTVSAGLAAFPEHARGSSRLVHVADDALYEAKACGRDTLVIATS